MKFVGLRPFDDEKRHWVAVNHSIAVEHLKKKKTLQPRQKVELERQSSITARESAAVREVTGLSIRTTGPGSPVTTPTPREETDFGGPRPSVGDGGQEFDARATWKRGLRKSELKPDLWKVAYNSISSIKNQVTLPVRKHAIFDLE